MRFWRRLARVGGFICCSAIGLWLTAVTAQAAVTDAPHNDTNGITCTSCHHYSFWWQYSPAQQRADFTTLVDTLCFDCHKDSGTGPKALTHSSTVINSGLHETWDPWDRACTACHNPHHQDQLEWANSVPTPYLVTGDISAVFYDPSTKETTITYANATSNPTWPPVGETIESLDWANKSLAYPGRGLILVQDTEKTSNTFAIIEASATTVTVKGEITADMIDPAYVDPNTNRQNFATCASFGLIYGDLIRNSINARSVKFFDPNGGFVKDEGSTPTGICQVCHTRTAHYTNDGVMPAGAVDSHVGRNGTNCTACHQHIKGFKGLGHDDNSFAWAGNCATCHNPSGAPVNIADGIHGKKCVLCHVSAAGGGARKVGDVANGTDGSALDATNSSTCVDCHLTKLGLTGATIHHVSANNYAAGGDCIHCHANTTGKLVAPHNTVVAGDSDCASCHTATAGQTTGMPVGPTDSKVHDACLTCHNTDGTLQSPYGQASAIPVGGGTCKTCHGDYFLLHLNKTDHSGQVDKAVTNCTSACHFHDKVDTIVDIHLNNCSHCHDLANGGVEISLAAQYGPGDCTNCHRDIAEDPMTHPKAMTHVGQVDREPTCSNTTGCHPGTAIQVHLNNCNNCHAWNWGLRTNFNPAKAFAITPGNCTVCHLQTANDGHGTPCPQNLGEALDAPELIWETSPTGAWTQICEISQSGGGSAQSVPGGVTSWLQTSIVGPGTLSFWWKISAGTDTMLQFTVDGVSPTPNIGPATGDWQLVSVPVAEGAYVFKWTHGHPFIGLDGPGYVDHVVWTPVP